MTETQLKFRRDRQQIRYDMGRKARAQIQVLLYNRLYHTFHQATYTTFGFGVWDYITVQLREDT